MPSITSNVPSQQLDLSQFKFPSNICLADPNFHSPSGIDMILGADVFWDLLGSQRIKLGQGQSTLTLCETKLGWLVCGSISSRQLCNIKCNFININESPQLDTLNNNIQHLMTRFWKLEEVTSDLFQYSKEEQSCENHFLKTTTRL